MDKISREPFLDGLYLDGIQKDIKDCFAHRFRRFYGVVQNKVTHLILLSGALRALVGGGVTPGCVALAGSSPGVMFVSRSGLGLRAPRKRIEK